MNLSRSFFLIFSFLLCAGLSAQDSTIRGNIFDKLTADPILYGTVQIKDTDRGTITDEDGFFTISGLEPGTYTVVATYIGYDSTQMTLTLNPGEVEYVKLNLEEATTLLGEVEVSARTEKARTEVTVSEIQISPKQLAELPTTSGQSDLAQYLPVLPGVIFTGDQGGQLYIRGGSPVQNKILLDGMTLYNPFHSIGFFSVVETEAIKNVDVYTGGFNAEYGGRISAIIDIQTRTGDKRHWGGLVSVSPFMGKAIIEGPIVSYDEEKGNSASFLLSAKKSFLENTSTGIYDYATENEDGLPFSFTDLYGKFSLIGASGGRLEMFGFNFEDEVDFTGITAIDWRNSGLGASFKLVPRNTNLTMDGVLAWSQYEINSKQQDNFPRRNSIRNFDLGINFHYFTGGDGQLDYGLSLQGLRTEFDFTTPVGFRLEQFENTSEIGIYAKYRRKFNNLIIEPGIRFHYYASVNIIKPEPRVGLKYNITNSLRIKAAAGLYSQNLLSAANERDVVSLFSGFISGPEEQLLDPQTNERVDDKLQYSSHLIAGVEIELSRALEINIEPYYKDFDQLISINRNKLTPSEPNYIVESGEAYGVDLSFRYDRKSLYVWATYSLGYVNRFDGEQEYPTIFDRRHNVNLVTNYEFGRDDSYRLGVKWNLGSGFPFTQTVGFFGRNNFREGPDTDIVTENPGAGIIFSDDRNAGRLPYYHRLDMSLSRIWEFSRYSSLEVVLSVTNAYNRENIFYIDRFTLDRVDQLSILPSLAVNFSF